MQCNVINFACMHAERERYIGAYTMQRDRERERERETEREGWKFHVALSSWLEKFADGCLAASNGYFRVLWGFRRQRLSTLRMWGSLACLGFQVWFRVRVSGWFWVFCLLVSCASPIHRLLAR